MVLIKEYRVCMPLTVEEVCGRLYFAFIILSEIKFLSHHFTVQDRTALYDSAPQSGAIGGGRGR